jgi:hypothetical protein
MRTGAREKFCAAALHENVKNGVIEGRIASVPVQLPVAIDQVNFDRSAHNRSIPDANDSILEIGSCFPVPEAKLDDLDGFPGSCLKLPSELAREPPRLKLKLTGNSGQSDQWAIAHCRLTQ